MSEAFTTSGTGINLKLGVLLRPIDQFRIGLSFHSPTAVTLTDEFSVRISHKHNLDVSNFTVSDRDTVTTAELRGFYSEYNLYTPYRVNLGTMYMLGKRGFITADVEYLNYGSARLRDIFPESDPAYYDYEGENDAIRDLFEPAVNTRFGLELREDVYHIRLGAAFYGTALDELAHIYEDVMNPGTSLILKPNRRMLTLGAGVRQPNYFLDVAYVNQLTKEKFSPYTTANTTLLDPTLISYVKSTSWVFTIGFRL